MRALKNQPSPWHLPHPPPVLGPVTFGLLLSVQVLDPQSSLFWLPPRMTAEDTISPSRTQSPRPAWSGLLRGQKRGALPLLAAGRAALRGPLRGTPLNGHFPRRTLSCEEFLGPEPSASLLSPGALTASVMAMPVGGETQMQSSERWIAWQTYPQDCVCKEVQQSPGGMGPLEMCGARGHVFVLSAPMSKWGVFSERPQRLPFTERFPRAWQC